MTEELKKFLLSAANALDAYAESLRSGGGNGGAAADGAKEPRAPRVKKEKAAEVAPAVPSAAATEIPAETPAAAPAAPTPEKKKAEKAPKDPYAGLTDEARSEKEVMDVALAYLARFQHLPAGEDGKARAKNWLKSQGYPEGITKLTDHKQRVAFIAWARGDMAANPVATAAAA